MDDLLDIAADTSCTPIMDRHRVVFHLTGALSEHGKVGITAIGETRAAQEWFDRASRTFDLETRHRPRRLNRPRLALRD